MGLGARLRLSVLCAALVVGVTARPFELQGKLKYDPFQEVMKSMDSFKAKQVEPPENQNVVAYKVDPLLTVWKSGRDGRLDKPGLEAEEDLDDLYHPTGTDLRRYVGKQYAFQVNNFQEEAFNMNNYQEPEEDIDDIAHPSYDRAREKTVERLADVLVMSEKEVTFNLHPEEDTDDLFHKNIQEADPYLRLGKAAAPADVSSQENYDGKLEVDLDFIFHQ